MGAAILARREKLNLSDGPRAILFRLIDRQLRSDHTLGRVIKIHRSWTGEPDDRNEMGRDSAPSIRLTSRSGPSSWKIPWVRVGTLVIDVDTIIRGSCSDDQDNLWDSIRAAICPVDVVARQEFWSMLQANGAWTGIVNVGQPSYDPRPDAGSDGMFRGSGQLSIEYRVDVDSP